MTVADIGADTAFVIVSVATTENTNTSFVTCPAVSTCVKLMLGLPAACRNPWLGPEVWIHIYDNGFEPVPVAVSVTKVPDVTVRSAIGATTGAVEAGAVTVTVTVDVDVVPLQPVIVRENNRLLFAETFGAVNVGLEIVVDDKTTPVGAVH